MTDEVIRALFEGASDFEARQLRSGPQALYAYYIDGLTSGGDISEYIIKPVSENLPEDIVCPLCKHGAADFEPIA